jgi:D-3-phosphoglycerate dehydrogenase
MSAKVVHIDAKPSADMKHEEAALREIGIELIRAGAETEAQIIDAARNASVIITDHAPITRAIMEQLPQCLAIIRTGTGYDSVDVSAATEHGIIVVNFPDYCTAEVANHALMFILACGKRLIWFDQGMRRGYYPQKYERDTALPPIGSIYEEQLGIIGLGRIGRALAVRARALGMRILACDPYIPEDVFAQYEAEPTSLNDLLERSDYVSLHTPLTAETRGMIGREQLERMKRSAYLINTSRGKVIQQEALVQALRDGWIAGAALDVFQDEPLPADSPLLSMDNVTLTPHVAGRSDVAFTLRLPQEIGQEAARIASGQLPRTIANPEVMAHARLTRFIK